MSNTQAAGSAAGMTERVQARWPRVTWREIRDARRRVIASREEQ